MCLTPSTFGRLASSSRICILLCHRSCLTGTPMHEREAPVIMLPCHMGWRHMLVLPMQVDERLQSCQAGWQRMLVLVPTLVICLTICDKGSSTSIMCMYISRSFMASVCSHADSKSCSSSSRCAGSGTRPIIVSPGVQPSARLHAS